jgi:hypothetical protein
MSSSSTARSTSPSPRRCRASSPQPRAPAAPHQPIEAPRLLPCCPPAPQPAEHRATITIGENPNRPAVDHPLLPRLRPNWVQKKHPRTLAKLMRAPSVPVRRPLAGNVCAPSRPPPSIVAGHAPPLLLEHITHQQAPLAP